MRVDWNLTADDLKKQKKHLRIEAVLPTIKFLIGRGAKVVILSHRGRPQSRKRQKRFSLNIFAKILSKLLKKPVYFINSFDFNRIKTEIKNSRPKTVFLLENLRFLPGEQKNDKVLARDLAKIGDFYVNDAFSVSHRENASVVAITKFLPAYGGLLLEKEIKNLSMTMKKPRRPLVIVLGGAKISDKIGLIINFLKRADVFLIGGGIANTFFAGQKIPLGKSLYEKKMVLLARRLLKSPKIILPIDSMIKNGSVLDIGPNTSQNYAEIIKKARTIVWNGPMGYIENPKFAKGSQVIAKAIIKSRAFAVIGGGETISLMSGIKYQASNKMFLSTGGGAMLEYLAGKKLPGIEALN